MRKTILCIATAMLAATPAVANDEDRFEGFSIGVDAGWQRNSAKVETQGDTLPREADNGISFRGRLGYDLQLADRFVIGVEAGIGKGGSTVNGSAGGVDFRVNPGLTLDASARAGVVLGRNLLVYGRLGYGNSRLAIETTGAADSAANIDIKDREGGLLFGGGAEFALSDNFSVRAEYRRQKLGQLKSKAVMGGVTLRF